MYRYERTYGHVFFWMVGFWTKWNFLGDWALCERTESMSSDIGTENSWKMGPKDAFYRL